MTEQDAVDLWAALNGGQDLKSILGWGRIAQAIIAASRGVRAHDVDAREKHGGGE
jgi:hypothetical protein